LGDDTKEDRIQKGEEITDANDKAKGVDISGETDPLLKGNDEG
jgi:hypothetical protein